MKLVTGANGFVGHKIMKMCPDCLPAPSLRNVSQDEVKRIVEESGADVIIHTAAISDTGSCERDPEASYQANVLLPVYLAKAAAGRKLICFSSDQVYNGCKEEGPYTEDMACPASVYARHKLEMEERVLALCPDSVMLRAEWMYDFKASRPNYLMNLLNARDSICISGNQFRGVTYLKEVVAFMEQVIKLPGGAYNYGSETNQPIYEITKDFVHFLGKDITIEKGESRHNLWIDCNKIKTYGIAFSDVLGGLKQCIKDYEKEIRNKHV